MEPEHDDLGMVGLGVMGSNLAMNMADHGFSIAGFDHDAGKVKSFLSADGKLPLDGTIDLREFVGSLKRPRAIMMMVPAGSPVDAVIHDLLPFLNINDLIIDGGNSYYKDTE
ncbi:MAG: NAD(P)-binding domain-containing protein, partial [Anaerolineaceae bacterium]|nr:NAD(P)-binding domain-containing protein [Anaerolineaceae bacterium]